MIYGESLWFDIPRTQSPWQCTALWGWSVCRFLGSCSSLPAQVLAVEVQPWSGSYCLDSRISHWCKTGPGHRCQSWWVALKAKNYVSFGCTSFSNMEVAVGSFIFILHLSLKKAAIVNKILSEAENQTKWSHQHPAEKLAHPLGGQMESLQAGWETQRSAGGSTL